MNTKINKVIILISTISLLTAAAALAEDRMVFGNVSVYEPSLPAYDSNTKILNVGHYRQSEKYTCGPAVVMNLMYYYKMLSAKELNPQTEMRISMEMDASATGTSEAQVVAWLSDHGFYVDYGQMVSTEFLINNISKGYPVIVGYENHWMLANGYNNSQSGDNAYILFSDTGSGHTRIKRSEIDSTWAISKLPYRNRSDAGYYILAVPYKQLH